MNEQYIEGEPLELEKKTVEVYVSKKGGMFLTQESALNDSYTHTKCDKHGVVHEIRSYCRECWEEKQDKRYNDFETVEWDGKSMLYSHATDSFYWSMEEVAEDAELQEVALENMRLSPCEPNNMHQVDEDYWCDVIADDGDLPIEIQESLAVFNNAVIEHGKSVSWSPVNKKILPQ